VTKDKVVKIADESGWDVLRARKATSVIDPMVVRVADLFARGKSGATTDAWGVIKNNVVGLATFVDALILEPGIPVFDYWYTGSEWGRNPALFEYTDPVVVPAGVEVNVWSPLGAEAAMTIRSNPRLPGTAAAEIAANLRDMRWEFITQEFGGADVSGSQTAGDPSGDALVNSYLYVALLFAGYAAKLGVEGRPGIQILSPGQAQMFVSTAAAEVFGAARPLAKDAVFGEIKAIINQTSPGYARTWQSDRLHFLPYLLALEDRQGKMKIRTSEQLFHEALALRERGDVSDYRTRLNQAQVRMEDGLDDVNWRKDLQRAEREVRSALNVKPSIVTLEVHAGVPEGIGANAKKEVDVSPLWSWLVSAWPGKRYHRVLTKLISSQAEVKQIERTLERIWRAS